MLLSRISIICSNLSPFIGIMRFGFLREKSFKFKVFHQLIDFLNGLANPCLRNGTPLREKYLTPCGFSHSDPLVSSFYPL